MITGYNGTFTKKNGESREMFFAHLQDLPQAALDDMIGSDHSKSAKSLPEGMELVFDLQNHDLRVFNHKTLQGDLEPYDIKVDDYWSE
jgi:hypothetical protein